MPSTLLGRVDTQEMLSEDIFHLKAWLTLPEAEDRAASSSKSSQLFPSALLSLTTLSSVLGATWLILHLVAWPFTTGTGISHCPAEGLCYGIYGRCLIDK